MERKLEIATLKEKVFQNDDDETKPDNQRQFIYKLFGLLENNEHPEIISWTSDGQSVMIKDTDGMTQIVLPKFFNNSKYPSFLRQFNYYGFKKASKAMKDKTYSHEYFKKGKFEMLAYIKRLTQSSTAAENQKGTSLSPQKKDLKITESEPESIMTRLMRAEALVEELRMENIRLNNHIREQNYKQQRSYFNPAIHQNMRFSNHQLIETSPYPPVFQNTQARVMTAENQNSPLHSGSLFNASNERFHPMNPMNKDSRFWSQYQTPIALPYPQSQVTDLKQQSHLTKEQTKPTPTIPGQSEQVLQIESASSSDYRYIQYHTQYP